MPGSQPKTSATPGMHRVKKRPRERKEREDVFPVIPTATTTTLQSVSRLERTISGILLRRFEADIARLFSTHVYRICERELPRLLQHFVVLGSPGWAARNAASDDVRDFFRATLAMDLRQAGERVATKSVLWSYTALRHFAVARGVAICDSRGLHSARLLPHHKALRAHLRTLDRTAALRQTIAKPPHLPSITRGGTWLPADIESLCADAPGSRAAAAWREKVCLSYERLADSLWACAREYDVRGYGLVLRDKLTTKWCECGCSTDHLGEVCERTVREDEDEAGRRPGKEREWDGRGSGVRGWNTSNEEDIWDIRLDFGVAAEDDDGTPPLDDDMLDLTVSELMEWRYFRAEKQKELGNTAFKRADYETAIDHYIRAREIEPELPHYSLNLAAAHLKLSQWIEAEDACTVALGQHSSSKGFWRRARARRMLHKHEDAICDLHEVLSISPGNIDALRELAELTLPYDGPSCSTTAFAHDPGPAPLAVPWDIAPEDSRVLRVVALPLMVDPASVGWSPGPQEKLACPSWDRYSVRRVE